MRFALLACAAVAAGLSVAGALSPVHAQRGGLFMGSADDPAIAYSTAPVSNVVDDLNRRIRDGSAVLRFEGRSGYLQSVLDALQLPVDSQLLLFSKGSLQARLISPSNPRALFFNDRAALGWVRDAELIEVAAHDDRLGVVFYTLEQRPSARQEFTREFRCLGCHLTGDTLGVPGLVMFSTTQELGDLGNRIVATDHRNRLSERWGGWFVTGSSGSARHRGNDLPSIPAASRTRVPSAEGLFDPDGHRALSSDIAALLTFSHQTHMVNLLTRVSWETRVADPAERTATTGVAATPSDPASRSLVESMVRGVAEEVVDYMLFIDEPPLPDAVSGSSGFTQRMSQNQPRDRQGRSLYELDLQTRLLKYPCSYLIYSPAFDRLPPLAKSMIYQRMWSVLSGQERDPRYRRLPVSDRRAIVEILRDTKPDLPPYFGAVTR
jgi:hypothetical protein